MAQGVLPSLRCYSFMYGVASLLRYLELPAIRRMVGLNGSGYRLVRITVVGGQCAEARRVARESGVLSIEDCPRRGNRGQPPAQTLQTMGEQCGKVCSVIHGDG